MDPETTSTSTTAEVKPWYMSKTILAAIAAGILGLLSAFHVAIPGVDAESVTEILLAIGSVIAMAVTIYGRIKAAKSVGA